MYSDGSVRKWSKIDSTLVWESRQSWALNSDLDSVELQENSGVAVADDGRVFALYRDTLFCWDMDGNFSFSEEIDGPTEKLLLKGNEIMVVGKLEASSNRLSIWSLDASNILVKSYLKLSSKSYRIGSMGEVISLDTNQITVFSDITESFDSKVVEIPNSLHSQFENFELSSVSSTTGIILVTFSSPNDYEDRVIVIQKPSFKITTTDLFGKCAALSGIISCVQYRQNSEIILVKEIDSKDLSTLSVKTFPYPRHGGVATVHPLFLEGKLMNVVVGNDESFSLVGAKIMYWTREEALASVSDAQFIDSVPHSAFLDALDGSSKEEKESQFPSFLPRLNAQFREITNFIHSLKNIENILPENIANYFQVSRKRFGLQKMLLILSECGKIFAFDAETGDDIWSIYLGPVAYNKFFVIRSKLTSGAMSPEIAIFLKSHVGNIDCVIIDVTSASVVERLPVKTAPEALDKIIATRLFDDDLRSLLLLLNKDGGFEILPATKAARSVFESTMDGIYWQERLDDSLHGLAVIPPFRRVDTIWKLNFSNSGEMISAIVDAPKGRVPTLYDTMVAGGPLVRRYINPNLLAIATASRGYDESSSYIQNPPAVRLYLLDGITGSVLRTIVQKDGEGPVRLHIVENIVLAAYFNRKEQRHELTIIELFHGDDFSETKIPSFIQQTYILPGSVESIGSTRTKFGVTTKEFIFALSSNQVLGVPRSLLNPRRGFSRTPTSEEKAAGLLPYNPVIPFSPQNMLSHVNPINHVRYIISSHTEMESTSLVLAYGLDMMVTQVAPAEKFDVLNEDFNLPFLLATVSAVAIGIIVSGHFASKKSLALKWE